MCALAEGQASYYRSESCRKIVPLCGKFSFRALSHLQCLRTPYSSCNSLVKRAKQWTFTVIPVEMAISFYSFYWYKFCKIQA